MKIEEPLWDHAGRVTKSVIIYCYTVAYENLFNAVFYNNKNNNSTCPWRIRIKRMILCKYEQLPNKFLSVTTVKQCKKLS